MKDDESIKYIADNIKAIHNAALGHIQEGKYEDAARMYEYGADVCRRIGYSGGVAMNVFCLANLAVLTGDLRKALEFSKEAEAGFDDAEDRENAADFRKKISAAFIDTAKQREMNGDLQGALDAYSAVRPFVEDHAASEIDAAIVRIKDIGNLP